MRATVKQTKRDRSMSKTRCGGATTDLDFDVLDGRRLGDPQPRVLPCVSSTLTNAFRLPRSTRCSGSRLLFRVLAAALWTLVVFTARNRFRTEESHGDVGKVVITAPSQ